MIFVLFLMIVKEKLFVWVELLLKSMPIFRPICKAVIGSNSHAPE